ncbi:hypothetical protein B7G55_08365 [Aeromonas hydrophila]|uniref:type IV toxin-antitoxin system YeeU family antitoxin n=1 Tax=Aeromonas hydrophila TaxID=644 RepID=UPI000A1DC1DB|nr:type IV toxin-antitoxin system YeeU family antitoxin [Aeromonas hydrophila]OSP51661.1 hypothetical protein B7G55_08365 [Aeromonas hydrophila]
MTTTTTHTNNQHPVAPDQPARIFVQWGLPHTVTPRFGARLIQSRYRLDFLSDRASLIGEWSQMQIAKLNLAFPEIIKELEARLLTGELDARCQQRITVYHGGFTCEADTLGSHGYVYICIYSAESMEATPDVRDSQS